MSTDGAYPIVLSRADLQEVFDVKYRRGPRLGWGPRMRLGFDYFNPDDHYEALVGKLVRAGTWWADVGCGRDIFPSNPTWARELSSRCAFLFGIDPSPNLRDNPFIRAGFEGLVEDCETAYRFDLITLRMVAEHVIEPQRVVAKLAELTKPGGMVVIYTPNRWAPMSVAASLVPNRFHHWFKRTVWEVDRRDTFPTAFRLNTRAALTRHTRANNLHEVDFRYLDDCRTFSRYYPLSYAELCMQKGLRSIGLHYPETCLLGVYRKFE